MFIIIIILYCSMRLKLFNSLNANYQVSSYHNVYLLLKVCTLYRIEKIVNANRWWKINFSIFIFWVMADCVNNLPIKKRVVQKWPNLQERCGLLYKWFFSSWVFFVRLLVLRYGLILMQVTSCRYAKDIRNFCEHDSDANQWG